jgi:hypothetical protein
MLNFSGRGARFCDGISRRGFLRVGSLSTGSLLGMNLSLGDLYRAAAAAAPTDQINARPKSVINIHLNGGPSHLDMFDMKPDAPAEFRGEFQPASSNVAGIQLNSLMPRLAKLADKWAVIRSITGVVDEHTPHQSESGFSEKDLKSVGGRPSLGSVVSKLHGTSNGNVPRFVDIAGFSNPGFLGATYGGFRADGKGRADLQQRTDMPAERLQTRTSLLSQLDHTRRALDNSRMMEAMDSFNHRALDVVTGGQMVAALDWEKESTATKERYGIGSTGENGEQKRFLLARRMIEVGARVVSLGFTGWDTHNDNFNILRKKLPLIDAGLSALLTDLDERGLLQDTVILMTGEFGRTPRINNMAGRDHWSRASSAWIAGGGLKMGQLIGSTNRNGEAPQDRPVHLGEVFATLYHVLGIDPHTTTINDPNGRPQYLTAKPDPIAELLG